MNKRHLLFDAPELRDAIPGSSVLQAIRVEMAVGASIDVVEKLLSDLEDARPGQSAALFLPDEQQPLWSAWGDAPPDRQSALFDLLVAHGLPMTTPLFWADGEPSDCVGMGPWCSVKTSLSLPGGSAESRENRAKAQKTTRVLIAKGSWPHPAFFAHRPELSKPYERLLQSAISELPFPPPGNTQKPDARVMAAQGAGEIFALLEADALARGIAQSAHSLRPDALQRPLALRV